MVGWRGALFLVILCNSLDLFTSLSSTRGHELALIELSGAVINDELLESNVGGIRTLKPFYEKYKSQSDPSSESMVYDTTEYQYLKTLCKIESVWSGIFAEWILCLLLRSFVLMKFQSSIRAGEFDPFLPQLNTKNIKIYQKAAVFLHEFLKDSKRVALRKEKLHDLLYYSLQHSIITLQSLSELALEYYNYLNKKHNTNVLGRNSMTNSFLLKQNSTFIPSNSPFTAPLSPIQNICRTILNTIPFMNSTLLLFNPKVAEGENENDLSKINIPAGTKSLCKELKPAPLSSAAAAFSPSVPISAPPKDHFSTASTSHNSFSPTSSTTAFSPSANSPLFSSHFSLINNAIGKVDPILLTYNHYHEELFHLQYDLLHFIKLRPPNYDHVYHHSIRRLMSLIDVINISIFNINVFCGPSATSGLKHYTKEDNIYAHLKPYPTFEKQRNRDMNSYLEGLKLTRKEVVDSFSSQLQFLQSASSCAEKAMGNGGVLHNMTIAARLASTSNFEGIRQENPNIKLPGQTAAELLVRIRQVDSSSSKWDNPQLKKNQKTSSSLPNNIAAKSVYENEREKVKQILEEMNSLISAINEKFRAMNDSKYQVFLNNWHSQVGVSRASLISIAKLSFELSLVFNQWIDLERVYSFPLSYVLKKGDLTTQESFSVTQLKLSTCQNSTCFEQLTYGNPPKGKKTKYIQASHGGAVYIKTADNELIMLDLHREPKTLQSENLNVKQSLPVSKEITEKKCSKVEKPSFTILNLRQQSMRLADEETKKMPNTAPCIVSKNDVNNSALPHIESADATFFTSSKDSENDGHDASDNEADLSNNFNGEFNSNQLSEDTTFENIDYQLLQSLLPPPNDDLYNVDSYFATRRLSTSTNEFSSASKNLLPYSFKAMSVENDLLFNFNLYNSNREGNNVKLEMQFWLSLNHHPSQISSCFTYSVDHYKPDETFNSSLERPDAFALYVTLTNDRRKTPFYGVYGWKERERGRDYRLGELDPLIEFFKQQKKYTMSVSIAHYTSYHSTYAKNLIKHLHSLNQRSRAETSYIDIIEKHHKAEAAQSLYAKTMDLLKY